MKKRQTYEVIGLMSGTSLDGLDIASCSFKFTEGAVRWTIDAAETVAYPSELCTALGEATSLAGEELALLDIRLGRWMGRQVTDFIKKFSCSPQLIASHGHTIFHQPEKQLTLQIGSGFELFAACGVNVVCDFRKLDVSLGGQGAPLVPVGDRLLFSDYTACLNLGGIANISFDRKDRRVAYDITFCNMVQNYLARKLGYDYDRDGHLALKGSIDDQLLDLLDQLEYYSLPYPKSLGYEYIEAHVLPLLRDDRRINDYLITCLEHSARKIGWAVGDIGRPCRILVTGGGAFHPVLMQKIRDHLPAQAILEEVSPLVVSFKEALVFAFLGVLRLRNEVNVLASVTGASTNTSSGVMIGSARL